MLCCAVLSHSVLSALCNPVGCNPPGCSAHGDSPGKNSGVGCHVLLQGIFLTQKLNRGLLHCRWILYQGGIKGAIRETREYWSGYLPGYLPDPEIEPGSPALQVDSLPAELPGKPFIQYMSFYSLLISQNMETYPYWCKQLHLLYLIYNILHMSISMGSQRVRHD